MLGPTAGIEDATRTKHPAKIRQRDLTGAPGNKRVATGNQLLTFAGDFRLIAAGQLATGLGTVPVMLSQQFSQRSYDTMLGFGAGVMLAASSFSLVIPALNVAKSQGAGNWSLPTTSEEHRPSR